MSILFSCSVHYWRHPRGRWEGVLDRLAAAGVQGIDTYVPWASHEREPGRFDFGDGDPSLDLPGFVGLVADRGMWVTLRPGPQINAEMNNFGLPDRIVRDPDVQAMGPTGGPVLCPSPPVLFPCPSYFSEKYMEEAGRWFAGIASAMAGVPGRVNPVRSVQVDNEASLFFRDAPFDQDYRPEAIAAWGAWLAGKGIPPREPPRAREPGREGLRLITSWVRFRQESLLRAIGRMRDLVRSSGLGTAPVTHNMPPAGLWAPLPARDLASVVDAPTTDVYATAGNLHDMRRQILSIASVTPQPFAAEMGCGTVWFAPSVGPFDNRFVTATALALGVRGFNLYMGAGRDRWIGGLIPESGEDDGADLLHFYQRLLRTLESVHIGDMRPVAGATILAPSEYVVHSIAAFPIPGGSPTLLASLGLPVHEMLVNDDWGLGLPVQHEFWRRLREAEDLLESLSVPWSLSDGRGDLPAVGVLLAPTWSYLSLRCVESVIRHVESGSTAIAGPEEPVMDETMDPYPDGILSRWKAMRATGRLVIAGTLGDAAVKTVMKAATRKHDASLPIDITVRAPGVMFLPHRVPGKHRWLTWLISTGGTGRNVMVPRKGFYWNQLLAVRERASGGEFMQKIGSQGEPLTIDVSGREVHLVSWSRTRVG